MMSARLAPETAPLVSSMTSAPHTNRIHRIKPWLETNKAYYGGHYTHTSLSGGSYFIKDAHFDYFMKEYYDAVFESKMPMSLTESIQDRPYTPFRLDIDFRWKSKSMERLYTQEDIKHILVKAMTVMEPMYQLEKDERIFFVLEKPNPVPVKDPKKDDMEDGTKYIKDGIHIMAPRITAQSAIHLHIREKLMGLCEENLKKYPFTNKISDIFDSSVLKTNNWIMYGSSKVNQPPYKVTHAYYVYSDHIEEAPIPSNKELVTLLSVRNKDNYTLFRLECEDTYLKLIEASNSVRRRNVGRLPEPSSKTPSIRATNRRRRPVDKNEVDIARKCIGLLSVERATTRNEWRAVGLAAHNIADELFDDWVKFSRLPEAYRNEPIETYENEWNQMNYTDLQKTIGIGSLKLYAKQDNPQGYAELKSEDIFALITDASRNKSVPEYDIARIIYKMYEKEYIYSSNQKCWFSYSIEKHRWTIDNDGIDLKIKFSTEVHDRFQRAQQYYASIQDASDQNDLNKKKADSIATMMKQVKSTGFKGRLMNECQELFIDKDHQFVNQLDTNTYLLCFENGVYDLSLREFRDGRPEDYISRSTGIDYIPYDESAPEIHEIKTFLKQILPIKSVRKRTMALMASFLHGSVRHETFEVWSGSGGNGKSKLTELIEMALGNTDLGYSYKISVSFLTNKRAQSNQACPEVVGLKGRRFASLAEPGEGARINAGLMKEMTGGDRITGRSLFKEPISFKPQHKMVLMCNDKPSLPPHDEGVWRRVRVTEFPAKFCDEPVPTNPFHIKKDTNLNKKLEEWAPYFMSMLIHYHENHFNEDGLPYCPEIERYIKDYRNKNEPFAEFYQECLTLSGDNAHGITFTEVYRVYENWFRHENGQLGSPKKRADLKEYLIRQLGTSALKDSMVMGIKFIKKTFGETMGFVSDDTDSRGSDDLDR